MVETLDGGMNCSTSGGCWETAFFKTFLPVKETPSIEDENKDGIGAGFLLVVLSACLLCNLQGGFCFLHGGKLKNVTCA